MTDTVTVSGLTVTTQLHRFVNEEALPGSGIEAAYFWDGLASIVSDFVPRHRALLTRRQELQVKIDQWHRANPGPPDPRAYEAFLRDIGYLLEEPTDVHVTTPGVDDEVATIPGPQLVVPLLNARFAVNAANARWGSLYDALYGSDVIPRDGELAPGEGYNPVRGAEVVARARAALDQAAPLAGGSHGNAHSYAIDEEGLAVGTSEGTLRLRDPSQLVGYLGAPSAPSSIVLIRHGLHVEIRIDRKHPIGATDAAGVSDVVLESAVSTIMDLEDSVAAVDTADKVLGYRNWMQLMDGTLTAEVRKGDASFTRAMNEDRTIVSATGEEVRLRGRALLFIRQVGHLMTTNAVLDQRGEEIPEGLLDAVMTALGSLRDLQGRTTRTNSVTKSMYVVKPKMHGPDEVALAVDLFARVEQLLGLDALTIKVGIMDEERRTSVNLKSCIAAASDRLAFINTGFLDRTGDEIHTSMHAGPMVRKADMRASAWIEAYEDRNVDIGLECGLIGHAQIGKGMWAAPDSLASMYKAKVAHPQAGATCAWVPSPTAATIHALHYHEVDVRARQEELRAQGRRARLSDLITIPLGDPDSWSADDKAAEIDNNLQSLLGYVVRWIDAGIGCSKVPDLSGESLMEDRATCRISSQHVTNWLLHSVVTPEDVDAAFARMAAVVDDQNAADPGYLPMAPGLDRIAFHAARALVFDGLNQPAGYTEPILHSRRISQKMQAASDRDQ